jgi:flagellar biosynthesis protein FliQ
MKIGLSAVSAVLVIALFFTLAIAVFAARGKTREE